MVVLPSCEIVTVALAETPEVIGASIHVAPASSEYCSFVTATSSVADIVNFTGPRYHGLRMPVNAAGSSVALASTGAAVSGACADAGLADSNAAPLAATSATPLRTRIQRSLLFAREPDLEPSNGVNTNLWPFDLGPMAIKRL